MSLIISNKATKQQLYILGELEYTGRGKYAADQLTLDEASKLIDELFTQKNMTAREIQKVTGDWYHTPIVEIAGITPEEYEDPFSSINKRKV